MSALVLVLFYRKLTGPSSLETVPRLQAKVNQLQEANTCMEKELQEAQQAASAAASTTVRDADLNIRIVQLETIISSMREENEELERVLTIKTKEIDEHDDRLIE
jgi:type II secretory pathway component PulM